MAEATYPESEVVDYLVAHLEVLEPGLSFVARNLHLPNVIGGKGFVDILARDQTGMFVVIEVKRSDSAAREAIHEILKYTELLSRERRIPRAHMRVIIASTTWHDLLVPFSLASRISEIPLTGIQLDGAVVGSPLVLTGRHLEPLDVQAEPEFSRIGVRYHVANAEEAESLWHEAVQRMALLGVDDGIGIVLRDGEERTVLHVVLGVITPGDPRAVAVAGQPLPPLVIAPGLLVDYRIGGDEAAEGRAAVALMNGPGGSEIAFAHELDRLVFADSWTVEKVLRTGAFSLQGELVHDLDLVFQASHRTGHGDVKYAGAARPSRVVAWHALRDAVNRVLDSNQRWLALLNAWLDEREREHPGVDVVVNLFNPRDFLAPVIFPERLNFRSMNPRVDIATLNAAGKQSLVALGRLMWDGSQHDIRSTYVDSYFTRHGYVLAKATGTTAQFDARLTDRLGLTYELLEPLDDGSGFVTLEILPDETLWRSAVLHDGDTGIRQRLGGFLSAHLSQLNELRDWVRVGVPPPNEFGQVPLFFSLEDAASLFGSLRKTGQDE